MQIDHDAFIDELEKIAKGEGDDRIKQLVGGALGVGVGIGALIAAKPMLRTHLGASIKAIGKGGAHLVERKKGLPVSVVRDAKELAKVIREKGIDPSKARIAISGTGGTGKSTMAKALSKELGMKHVYLDDVGKSLKGRDLVGYMKSNPPAGGNIYEQTHLINQINPDKFDVIIRMAKDPKRIKKQLKIRERGAYQWDVLNYDKLHKAISAGFNQTKGKALTPVEGIQLKVKPKGGFQADQTLDSTLRYVGIRPEGMTRQEKVIAAATGKKPSLPGLLPFVRKDTILQAAAAMGVGGAAGAVAADQVV